MHLECTETQGTSINNSCQCLARNTAKQCYFIFQAAGVGILAIGTYPGPELGENTRHLESEFGEKHHSVGESCDPAGVTTIWHPATQATQPPQLPCQPCCSPSPEFPPSPPEIAPLHLLLFLHPEVTYKSSKRPGGSSPL